MLKKQKKIKIRKLMPLLLIMKKGLKKKENQKIKKIKKKEKKRERKINKKMKKIKL